MSVFSYEPDVSAERCDFCGDGWDVSDMYSCDICGRTMCCECMANVDDECPIDCCEECVDDPPDPSDWEQQYPDVHYG